MTCSAPIVKATMMFAQSAFLLLTLAVTSSRGKATEKSNTCGSVIELTCTATAVPGVSYRSVRWYKADEENHLKGLVRRRLTQNNTVEYYKDLIQHVEFASENSSNLILHNVTKMDSGRYVCLLAAPLGQQNQEGEVLLTVSGCQNYDVIELASAIALLSAALLSLTLSYICLRNALRSDRRKLIKESLQKLSNPQGNMIYVMGKDGLKTFECIYV